MAASLPVMMILVLVSESSTCRSHGAVPIIVGNSLTSLVSTKLGTVHLRIPKLRTGSFFPSLLERRRRVDQALFAVVMEAYLHGVSTRKVDDLVKALGADTGISKSEVSRICADMDGQEIPFARVTFANHCALCLGRRSWVA